MDDVTISPQTAAHVLHHFGFSAIQPGSMTASLIEAIARMDTGNMARMMRAFPGHVKAVCMAMGNEEGITRLQEIAGAYCSPSSERSTQWAADEARTLARVLYRAPLSARTHREIEGHVSAIIAAIEKDKGTADG